MFAGPNGSGKTTLTEGIKSKRPLTWFGEYINPDELEKVIGNAPCFSLKDWELSASLSEVREFFSQSPLLQRLQLDRDAYRIDFDGEVIDFSSVTVNSYHMAVLADFLRSKLLTARRSFSFETVMSSRDKVDLLQKAQSLGFRTYLYFIATEDPNINVERVKLRVSQGGHDVPADKIRSRYRRSIGNLLEAIKASNRAFLFDTTTGADIVCFAEVTDGKTIDLKSDEIPHWFQAIWDQF